MKQAKRLQISDAERKSNKNLQDKKGYEMGKCYFVFNEGEMCIQI